MYLKLYLVYAHTHIEYFNIARVPFNGDIVNHQLISFPASLARLSTAAYNYFRVLEYCALSFAVQLLHIIFP